MDTEYHNMSLKETLKYERERSAVEKIDLQDEIEKRDDTIATLTPEFTRLTEALRAHNMKVRRMLKAMDAVRLLRSSDGDADTEAVVAALNKIAALGIGTFCDALTVLKPETAPTYSKPGTGVKGLGPKVVAKLRLACALVALNMKPRTWVADLFPDTWEEQWPKTVADMAKQTAPVQHPPTKRKKAA
ncbi:unnamed protein product [Closterium sp. Naga37s-1]|nr:unnamed protein product [Closterium sp. Naga37s-1]